VSRIRPGPGRTLPVLFLALYTISVACESESGRPLQQGMPGAASGAGTGGAGAFAPPGPTGGSSGAGASGVGTGGSGPEIDAATAGATGGTSGAGSGGDAALPQVDAAVAGQDGAVEPPAGDGPADPAASAEALQQLTDHLALPVGSRGEIASQPFARTPLTRSDAEAARVAIWQDLAEQLTASRRAEHEAKSITIGDYTLRYETVVLGSEPPTGRSLFISMHGGGSAPASTNDSQWLNQIDLGTSYNPQDALWVAPRAPTDDWNMWFKDHIDGLFDRLITNMIVFEGIDPDKVYLTGYSAGGDGVYALTPRTADRWAGAAMSAGHPNGISLANVRNVAFAIYVGANDSAYDRNTVGMEYAALLDALQAADPGGYPHQSGFPPTDHWMNLADQAAIPFIQGFNRDAVPDRVVWEQHAVTHSRLYWLAVEASDEREGTRAVASYQGQTVTVEQAEGLSGLVVRFSDAMLDMDQPLSIVQAGTTLFQGQVERTITVIAKTLQGREDPRMVYLGEVTVTLAP
jgi:poly(3-hydroxybutyrate) depolymerase